MGCFLISFCLGNIALPLADGLAGDAQKHRQLLLRHVSLRPQILQVGLEIAHHPVLMFESLPFEEGAMASLCNTTRRSVHHPLVASHNATAIRHATDGCIRDIPTIPHIQHHRRAHEPISRCERQTIHQNRCNRESVLLTPAQPATRTRVEMETQTCRWRYE